MVDQAPKQFFLAEIATELGFSNHYVVAGDLSSISKRCYDRGRNLMWGYAEQPDGRYIVWISEELASMFDRALHQAGK